MNTTTTEVNRINLNGTANHETNGKAKKTSAKKKSTTTRRGPTKKTLAKARLDTFRVSITIALGIAIPALSLALSHIAGTLARTEHYALAAFAGLCGVSVLCVSLSHLSEALEDITHARQWQAWLLAITLDLSLIACELVQVCASNANLIAWCLCVMLVVCIFSMALNCYAFLACKR